MDTTPPSDSAPVEQEWRTLARKLRLVDGFCFLVYFVEDQRASKLLKRRVEELAPRIGMQLREVAVADAGALSSASLSRLLDASNEGDAVRPLFWLEAFLHAGDAAWDAARRDLLMRMNERRSRLESTLRGPLLLLLPAGAQRLAATLAPDLWHIRIHSATLAGMVADAAPVEVLLAVDNARHTHRADLLQPPIELPHQLRDWRHILDRQRRADPADQVLMALSLWDGVDAAHALLRDGHAALACEVAQEVLDLARQRLQRKGHGAQGTGARADLAMALQLVGDTERALGRSDPAVAAYQEALALRRDLASVDPDNTERQRDLGFAMDHVGRVRQAQGQLEQAHSAYQEALALRRRLVRGDPGNAKWQRDLGVALDNLGSILLAQGRSDEALAVYEEALALARRGVRADPDNLQWQRAVGIALDNLGRVHQAQGHVAKALAAYEEALALRRRMAQAEPGNVQWLRALGITLNNVGRIWQTQGRLDQALAAYEEALSLRRRLAQVDPLNPQGQRDLSSNLTRLAELADQSGDRIRALALARDSLAIDEHMAHLDPANETWQRDLRVSRALVARWSTQS